jgi:DNA-directed RNA polymerase subunit RPC12/RpoP
MSTPERERFFDIDCPYCLLRREIVTIKFSLLKSPTALFVCSSCGSALTDDDRLSTDTRGLEQKAAAGREPLEKIPVRAGNSGRERLREALTKFISKAGALLPET